MKAREPCYGLTRFTFYVNIPIPLAAALDLRAGERIRWQPLGRCDLRLVRLEAPSPAKGLKR